MNENQKQLFLKQVKRETGRDYNYLTEFDYDPVEAFSQVVLPGKVQPPKREKVKLEKRPSELIKAKEEISMTNLLSSGIKLKYKSPSKTKTIKS